MVGSNGHEGSGGGDQRPSFVGSVPRPCRGWAVLASRGGSPGTALLPGRARHGHEVGRAWAVLFSAVPVPAHRVSAIWKSIDVRTTERVSPYVLNNSTGVVRSWARKNRLLACCLLCSAVLHQLLAGCCLRSAVATRHHTTKFGCVASPPPGVSYAPFLPFVSHAACSLLCILFPLLLIFYYLK